VKNIKNLHQDLIADGLEVVKDIENGGYTGDHYNVKTKVWTAHPENYPAESAAKIYEKEIQAEMRQIAIDSITSKAVVKEIGASDGS